MSTTIQTTTEQLLHAPGRAQGIVIVNSRRKNGYQYVRNSGNVLRTAINSSGRSSPYSKPSVEVPSNPSLDYSRPSSDPEPSISKFNASNGLKIKSPVKRAGEFILGPKHGSSPVKCIQQFLARKDGTDEFYVLKILTQKGQDEKETMDDIQGKTLLHTEHSLLSLVQNAFGVIHEHGLFKDTITEESVNANGEVTTKEVKRLFLVLDCYVTHDFHPKYSNITNMQYHVIKDKKLPEVDAIRIFYKVVQIVERLHKVNIVHRDLKLGNIIFNKDTKDVTLANFCLGKHLSSENEMLKDQRGSPAYISPDVISGKPYLGKPSDMWALGVVLYTMLYGQFPFYDQNPTELFRKIKLGQFLTPVEVNVSPKTVELIRSLLDVDPNQRLTAAAALEKVRTIISDEQAFMSSDSDLQVVPDCHPGADRPKKRSHSDRHANDALVLAVADFAAYLVESELEAGTSEIDEWEPKCKKGYFGSSKVSVPGIGYMAREDLERLHALCRARREQTNPTSPISEVPTQFSSSSSNGLTKCATNNDSARVPDSDFDNVNVMSPTSVSSSSSVSENKLELLDNDDNESTLHKQRSSNNNNNNNFSFFHVQ